MMSFTIFPAIDLRGGNVSGCFKAITIKKRFTEIHRLLSPSRL